MLWVSCPAIKGQRTTAPKAEACSKARHVVTSSSLCVPSSNDVNEQTCKQLQEGEEEEGETSCPSQSTRA